MSLKPNNNGIIDIPVGDSKKLAGLLYNINNSVLTAIFPVRKEAGKGVLYHYADVPDSVVDQFEESYNGGESVGSLFSTIIEKAGYKYEVGATVDLGA